NIGAGKTNLAKKLAEHFHWHLYDEPFTINPYLENFYQDMAKWAFHCEISFLSHRLDNHLDILNKEESVIQDRCLYEGAEVFVKNLYQTNRLSEIDWQTYQHLYQTGHKLVTPPDLIVYIKSSTDRCMNNLMKRGREMESGMDRQYIDDLNKLYKDWIDNWTLCPVLTANADLYDFKYDESAFRNLTETIKKRLKNYELPLEWGQRA
ncbi:MAG: deoxynucleoside kinase, partial [Parcubacteria group bacterium]